MNLSMSIGLNTRRAGDGFPNILRGNGPSLFVFDDAFGADGVTPVALQGAISLAVDDFEGLELGAELVPDGSFSSGVGGWVDVGSNSAIPSDRIVDGALQVSNTGTQNAARPLTAPAIGRYVLVRFRARRVGGDAVTLLVRFSNIFGADTVLAQSFGNIATDWVSYSLVYVNSAPSRSRIVFREGAGLGSAVQIDDVSVREVLNFPAFQNTAAARGLRGQAPKEVRNLLTGTATMATQTRAVTAAQHRLSFKGTGTVTLTGSSTAGPLVGTGAGDIVGLTFTPTAGNLTLTVSGSVTEAQLELGSARSAYQEVGTGLAPDITEAGVTSHPVWAGDGTDDAADCRVYNGQTFGIFIPGRYGSWWQGGFTAAADGTITVGPTSVFFNGVALAGVPTGILRACGTVPWSSRLLVAGLNPFAITKSVMSTEELRLLVRRYAAIGAKGLLVPGADQAVSGVFAADTDWTKGTGWTIGSGVATKTAGTAAALEQAQTIVAATPYLCTADVTRSAGTLTPRFTGGTTFNGTAVSATGALSSILMGLVGNTTFGFQGDSAFAGTVDNVTLRPLTPEPL
jgi:hypothetical protein